MLDSSVKAQLDIAANNSGSTRLDEGIMLA